VVDWEETTAMPAAVPCMSLRPLGHAPPFRRAQMQELGLGGIQFGSMTRLRPRWLSLDICRFVDLVGRTTGPDRIWVVDGGHFLEQDATRALPFEDGCFDRAYSEHFIEHIRPREAIAWLREVRRVLRPGGLMRLTTPDLRRYVEGYLDGRDAFFAEHRRRLEAAGLPPMETRKAFMVNQIFRFWGHRWIYDVDELRHVLAEAGFDLARFEVRAFAQGADPEIAKLDLALRSDETLYVEVNA
jgi:predicted SAM-dependent methyltransferase